MGQFDSPSEAALNQLKIEHAAISPVGVVVGVFGTTGRKVRLGVSIC